MPKKTITVVTLLAALCSLPATAAVTPLPAPPTVTAQAYLLIDHQSGRDLAAREPDQRVEPASITKVMTGYVIFRELAAENINLQDQVSVSEHAWRKSMGTSRMFLEPNTQVSVESLLMGMIIQSGNDASIALAEHVAGSEETFASLMNAYAAELGMTGTNFTNSTGLPDANHYTTARDLATVATAVIKEFPEYYQWYSIPEYTYNGISQPNRNRLLGKDAGVDGIKTGWTESAGYCLLASAVRDGQRLISVVVNAPSSRSRVVATEALLNYGYRFFETHRIYAAGEKITSVRVWKGAREDISLGLRGDLYVTIPRGRYDELEATMDLENQLVAPIESDQAIGLVTVSLEGEPPIERDLFPLESVPEGNLWQRLKDEVLLWFE
jgi:D-alanyl-D-alanine carboxypeptidase (penicillin-binding protein 5/6)